MAIKRNKEIEYMKVSYLGLEDYDFCGIFNREMKISKIGFFGGRNKGKINIIKKINDLIKETKCK